MFRWMGSQFHDWIDSYEVAFSIELLEQGRTFSGFRRYENSGRWDLNIGRFAIKRRYRWDRKNYIRPKMESIMGPRIDHSGVRVLRGQRHKVLIDSIIPPPPGPWQSPTSNLSPTTFYTRSDDSSHAGHATIFLCFVFCNEKKISREAYIVLLLSFSVSN